MSEKSNKHNPSAYRGLIREQKAKNGRNIKELISEARTLQDPYYQSLALFRLSDDPRLSVSDAKQLAHNAIKLAEKEPRLWRRAELYATLTKHAKNWREKSSIDVNEFFLDEILKRLHDFPKGKGLSQNMGEISKHIGCSRLVALLEIARNNTDFSLDDCKTVIRQWATTCLQNIPPKQLYTILSTINDPFLKSKLMGYLYLQCYKQNILFSEAFETAITATLELNGEKQLSSLRYLSRHIQSTSDFEQLKASIQQVTKPEYKAQLFATLAGHADKKGFLDIRNNLFNESLEECTLIKDALEKGKTLFTISKGLLKTNEKERAKHILEQLHNHTNDVKLKQSIELTMKQHTLNVDHLQEMSKTKPKSKNDTSKLPDSTGLILGLYDTYEGGIKPIHVRTLARAAPLCAAFGLDLGLIGFPIKRLDDLIKQVITDTTIGKGGSYLQFLYEKQRIHLYPCKKQSVPQFPNEEIIIATTARPDKNKKISTEQAMQQQQNKKKDLILIMGLGKKGLPDSFLQQVHYHLELTGVNVSLETCTAMGILALKIHTELSHNDKLDI